jgi:dolichol-phosphate mannosyltransferase
MWREWGRSIDLADATPAATQYVDLALLFLAQALPVFVIMATFVVAVPLSLMAANVLLAAIRVGVLISIAPSYERRGWPFYLSVLADPLAFLRVALSTFRRPVSWRGRRYR